MIKTRNKHDMIKIHTNKTIEKDLNITYNFSQITETLYTTTAYNTHRSTPTITAFYIALP